jgi:predicted permease
MSLINSLFIIFSLVAVGVVSGRKKVLDHSQIEGFEAFLFKIGLPCYLFIAALKHDISMLLHAGYITSYLTTFAIISVFVILLFYRHRPLSSICIRALASGYSNAAIYALPIIVFLLNDPIAGIIANILQVVVIQSITVTALSFIRHKEKSIARRLATILSTPLIIMPILGLILNYLRFIPNPAIITVIESLGNSASTIALFAFGLRLSTLKVTKDSFNKNLFLIIFLKNIMHPIVAFLVGKYIFTLEVYWLYSLVIVSSAPTAFIVYLISKQFSIEDELMKMVVAISAIASLISLVFITAVLF